MPTDGEPKGKPETPAAPTDGAASETCVDCGHSLVPLKTHIYVKRPCETCGRDTYRQDRDSKTSGILINKGDQVTLSGDFINRMFRLVGGGRFSERGLQFFAQRVFAPQQNLLRESEQHLAPLLQAWEEDADKFVDQSGVFKGVDQEDPKDGPEIERRITEEAKKASAVYWALETGSWTIPAVRKAIEQGDAVAAAGAAIAATSAHAMLMYKVHLEEAVRRGHAVEALRSAVVTWNANRKNDSEEFWQQMLTQHDFVLGHALSAPAVVVAGKAYVGGKAVDNTGGSLADFLLKNELTRLTTLIELKAPTTPLLGPRYRNRVYPPSPELAGAVSQVMTYAAELAEDPKLGDRASEPFDTARAECLVIAGSADELADFDRRRAFSMYRSELRNVRIMTFDELFKRVETLLKLFGG